MPPILLTNLMLQDGNTFSLVEDSLGHTGRPLLCALVDRISERVDQIHVLTTEIEPAEMGSSFGSAAKSKLTVHNFWTDPLGWREGSDGGTSLRLDTEDTTFLPLVQCRLGAAPCRVAVVIDTISSFLPYKTDSQISTEISTLLSAAENVSQIQSISVFALLHPDLHSTKTLTVLRYLARIQVRLLPNSPKSPILKDAQGVFEVTVDKRNGKVKKQIEVYHISESHVITTAVYEQLHHLDTYEEARCVTLGSLKEMAWQIGKIQDKIMRNPDPAANLTFNLTLTDSERRAKENVVLPYTAKQEQPKSDQGHIFYEPDEADDFDEEDPDDDLDI